MLYLFKNNRHMTSAYPTPFKPKALNISGYK
jgi:hypothetical protein